MAHRRGKAAAGAGFVDTALITFNNGTGSLVFNHTDGNYVFGTSLTSPGTGTHDITHLAGTTNYTGDGSAFSGATTVSGGRFLVNGVLGGTIAVNGGVLGGAGAIGTTLIAAGGTIAPGNSIGTLTVNGDLTFAPGSRYEVEVGPGGASDRIDVTGTAFIQGAASFMSAWPAPMTRTPPTRS